MLKKLTELWCRYLRETILATTGNYKDLRWKLYIQMSEIKRETKTTSEAKRLQGYTVVTEDWWDATCYNDRMVITTKRFKTNRDTSDELY